MNHYQAKAVEQRDDGQQQRIGVRREPPNRQVRAAEQRQNAMVYCTRFQWALLLVGLDEQQRQRGDHRGEPEQEQLGVASVGQWRHHGDGRLRLCRHATARQFVPGSAAAEAAR